MAKAKRLHKTRFPGESAAYRDARDSLLRSEMELRQKIEAVAAQRRKLPLGGELPMDYAFKAWSPDADAISTIRFSELFAPGKDTLFLYNFMFPQSLESGAPCPLCTSIIDAVDGAARHVSQRVNFAVVAKAPIARFRDHAKRRGWRHTLLLSASGNSFKRDYHAESPEGQQFPIAQVFVRRRWQDPPFLEQRALVDQAQTRTGHEACRFHVADVEHLRQHTRRARQGLGAGAQIQVTPAFR